MCVNLLALFLHFLPNSGKRPQGIFRKSRYDHLIDLVKAHLLLLYTDSPGPTTKKICSKKTFSENLQSEITVSQIQYPRFKFSAQASFFKTYQTKKDPRR